MTLCQPALRPDSPATSLVTEELESWCLHIVTCKIRTRTALLGMNIFCDEANGILKMDIESKIDGSFKDNPDISGVHGLNAPYLTCFGQQA